jgi:hypothetical protein
MYSVLSSVVKASASASGFWLQPKPEASWIFEARSQLGKNLKPEAEIS